MNKYTKHTPGPWELSNDHKPSPYVIRQVGRFGGLASVKFRGFNKTERAREEQTANARLIAAAPDLFEAVQRALRVAEADLQERLSHGECEGADYDAVVDCINVYRAAIAKVGGAE